MYYYCDENRQVLRIPPVNSIVFVEIVNFSQNNTYCKLLEYNDLEGFLLDTELDRKVHDPRTCFVSGAIYPMLVIANMRNGEINVDLSYKKVEKKIRDELLLKFNNVKKLYTILNEFCFLTGVEFDVAQRSVLFPKLHINSQKYLDEAGNIYKQYLKNPAEFFQSVNDFLQDEVTLFVNNTLQRLEVSKMIVYQQFRLWVMESNSLEILKEILNGYTKEGCKIVYISSPKYQLTITCNNDEERQELLNDFLSYVGEQRKIHNVKFELDESQLVQDQEFILHPLNTFAKET